MRHIDFDFEWLEQIRLRHAMQSEQLRVALKISRARAEQVQLAIYRWNVALNTANMRLRQALRNRDASDAILRSAQVRSAPRARRDSGGGAAHGAGPIGTLAGSQVGPTNVAISLAPRVNAEVLALGHERARCTPTGGAVLLRSALDRCSYSDP